MYQRGSSPDLLALWNVRTGECPFGHVVGLETIEELARDDLVEAFFSGVPLPGIRLDLGKP